MNIHSVIIRPIITENSMSDAEKGKFTFEVAKQADKKDIKKAVEEKFKVDVVNISIRIAKGKKRRFGTRRVEVQASDWKKAVVTLKSGQKIDLFEIKS